MPSKKCYRCNEDSVTREHVPPLSFFPTEHRNNLITVPSCRLHNNDNSKDVEYVRNIISMSRSANIVGSKYFWSKGFRSLKRSPKLLKRTFNLQEFVGVEKQWHFGFQTDRNGFEN